MTTREIHELLSIARDVGDALGEICENVETVEDEMAAVIALTQAVAVRVGPYQPSRFVDLAEKVARTGDAPAVEAATSRLPFTEELPVRNAFALVNAWRKFTANPSTREAFWQAVDTAEKAALAVTPATGGH